LSHVTSSPRQRLRPLQGATLPPGFRSPSGFEKWGPTPSLEATNALGPRIFAGCPDLLRPSATSAVVAVCLPRRENAGPRRVRWRLPVFTIPGLGRTGARLPVRPFFAAALQHFFQSGGHVDCRNRYSTGSALHLRGELIHEGFVREGCF